MTPRHGYDRPEGIVPVTQLLVRGPLAEEHNPPDAIYADDTGFIDPFERSA